MIRQTKQSWEESRKNSMKNQKGEREREPNQDQDLLRIPLLSFLIALDSTLVVLELSAKTINLFLHFLHLPSVHVRQCTWFICSKFETGKRTASHRAQKRLLSTFWHVRVEFQMDFIVIGRDAPLTGYWLANHGTIIASLLVVWWFRLLHENFIYTNRTHLAVPLFNCKM